MTRKIKSGALALVLGLTVCFGALAQMPVPAAETASPDDPMLQLQKLNQFYRYLNGTYVDTVHNDALVEKAIREMLLQLDPHSTYLTAEEMKGVKEVFDGSFSGIGIEFNVLSDTVIVVNVIAGGPSEKVGLLPNDRIVKADGKNIVGSSTCPKSCAARKALASTWRSYGTGRRLRWNFRSSATTFRSTRSTPLTKSIPRPAISGSIALRTTPTRSSSKPTKNSDRSMR